MKAAIYARVSSDEQVEGYSIDAQLRTCREATNLYFSLARIVLQVLQARFAWPFASW